MGVFDGLADIFTDPAVFGEAVTYTPVATGTPKIINAIWWEVPMNIVLDDGVGTGGQRTQLHVRAADIANPAEGDIATRVADGKTMTVSTPIDPDGKGMIVCNLSK